MDRQTNRSDRNSKPPVLFVQPDDRSSEENEAARAWLNALPDIEAFSVRLSDLPETLLGYRCSVWFHWTRPLVLSDAERLALDTHVRAGGGILATLAAARLPVEFGWETTAPNEVFDGEWSEDAEEETRTGDFSLTRRMRGLQSFRGHPLFNDLGSGAYTWAPADGERFVRYAYTGETWPTRGRVVAVEKSFIAMDPDRRLAWEQMIGDGWVLCVGGYLYFAAADEKYRPHLERLIRNALARVAPNGHRVRLMGGAWNPPSIGVAAADDVPLPPALEYDPSPTALDFLFEPRDESLVLERAAGDVRYTLAGTRSMLVGRERTGHEEVWFHPNRAVSGWSLETAAGDVAGNTIEASAIRVRPGVVLRRLEVGGATVEERTTVAPAEAAVLVELRPEGGSVGVAWELESDLRLMWPYPAHSTGKLSYSIGVGAVGVRAESGEWLGVRIEPAPESIAVGDASDAERSRIRIGAVLQLDQPTRILLQGAGVYEQLLGEVDLRAWAQRRLTERSAQRGRSLVLGAREADGVLDLDQAQEWANWRLSTYRVTVPGLGTSLVAGYGHSGPGEFGDGRPGYAWFFGRDACWTALACLAVGQYDVVRETLEFLARHQDITGKILHECTTSGVVHYDAADSTPLFLLLAARYLATTDDTETIEYLWPHLDRAYRFCLSTDSDGDGLIENAGVGHGWVEFGELGANHVSLYLAGVWVAALSAFEKAARVLGRAAFADELAYRAAAARSSLELSLFDPIERRYATGRRPDGSLNMVETVMTAVPLLLDSLTPERCDSWLERVASDEFTAPWGVRLIPRSAPDYRPEGYHAGAVWPLYTGWVSLAELRAGRTEAALKHWQQVALLYKHDQLGAWPEVLHGEEARSIGVTSDQAWSTAMVILPVSGKR